MGVSFIKKSQFYFIFSFLALIIAGTLLLRLPVVRGGGTLPWVDALFTATSSVCVTGLLTVNMCNFTLWGQMIILVLIQLGGIGILTMSGSILLFMGRNMSWSASQMYSNITDNYSPRGLETMIRAIVIYMIIVETLGMFLLLAGFMFSGYSFTDALWHSLFHAVSAFCNAGISTLSGNLTGVSSFIKIVTSGLIVFGGIGMYVVYDIYQGFMQNRKLRVNTKIILLCTAILIISGTLLIKYFQYVNENPVSWVDALFQSVTARTAGFNSVPMSILAPGSVLVLIFLMLIGGAPGSTAGGMKVTTFSLVIAAVVNTFLGNEKVLIFKRKIATSTVLKAFTIAMTFIVLTGFGAGVFHYLTEVNMQKAFFEVVSALGTVGLSLGIDDAYTVNGKLFIISYMFIGRIGPLTLMFFLLGREKKSKLLYPEEKVIIG